LALEPGIRPDENGCKPLADYAFNCISQSNSKAARTSRFEILKDLLVSKTAKPNPRQCELMKFYELNETSLIKEGNYLVFDSDKLMSVLK